MQLQIGKKRRSLEEAFDARTAELRVLSERKYLPLAPSPIQIRQDQSPNSQTPLSVSSDATKMGQPHLLIQHGMKCRVILLAETLIIGVTISNLLIAGMSWSCGRMCMGKIHSRCGLLNGGLIMVDGVRPFQANLKSKHTDDIVTACVTRFQHRMIEETADGVASSLDWILSLELA